MEGFSSKDFYGHSLSEDPKLRTTTRNYEFRFNSSCHLEKMINRVQMDRERKRENELLADVCMMPRRVRPQVAREVQVPAKVVCQPTNVETHIGRSRAAVVRIMSDEEIESMISQALVTSCYAPSTTSALPRSDNRIKAEKPFVEQRKIESKTAIQNLEIAPALEPQWVEIKPTEMATANVIFLPFIALESGRSFEEELDLRSYAALSDEISMDNLQICDYDSDAPTPRIEAESPLPSPSSYGLEPTLDEDERAEMMRAFGLPEVPDIELHSLDSADETESSGLYQASEDDEGQDNVRANPVQPVVYIRELEGPRSYPIPEESHFDLHDLQTPMTIDDTARSFEMAPHSPAKRDQEKTPRDNGQITIQSSPYSSCEELQPTTPRDRNMIIPEETPRSHEEQSISSAMPNNYEKPQKQRSSIKPSKRNQLASQEISSDNQQMPLPIIRTHKMSSKQKKEIEAIKYEKIRIFSKMTSIQEEIIEGLDKLRMSLLDLTLPDGHVERKLRERNALEFSVRFSRNYLFPLGRWIEEIQASPKEEYQSSVTNEPCDKVCGVYGLLNQALQCYHKQLRHLFNENVPKKLDVLLQMIMTTTNICLKKKVFDKRDTLIQCLLTRSASFLEFITKMSEEKRSARQERDSVRSARRDQLLKTSSKWDLTMSLNNLNMYEPKLVAKKPKKKPQPKVTPTLSSSRAPPPRPSKLSTRVRVDKDVVTIPEPDPVDTEVTKFGNAESMQLLTTAIEEHPDSELTRTVIETLQDITKDEVRQMLNPILSNLDSILKNSDNPQNVESMLDALNSELLAQCKQQKIDAAAAENSTQNSNTYQKEVTKKGADSSKSKQRKENRVRRVSKTRCSNNVKAGSTEQTERYNSRDRSTDTKRDKQSPRNVDDDDDDVADVVVDENTSMKQHKSRSRSLAGGRGAFLSVKTAVAAARKPTSPAPAARTKGIPKPSPPSSPLPRVQLDEVMPSQTQAKANQKMTSRDGEHSASLPVVVDTFALAECQHEVVGANRKVNASQRKVNDGAANAEDNQEACRRHPRAKSSSGEMNQLNYSSNAQYTFLKHCEDTTPSTSNLHAHPEGTCPSESCTKFSTRPSNSDSFKSAHSTENILPPPEHVSQCIICEEDVSRLVENRNKFIEKCKEDPLYSNPMFPKPWKVLSKISLSITEDIVGELEGDVSFGEQSYVRDFINAEMQN